MRFFYLLLLGLLLSCGKQNEMVDKLEEIKLVGNIDPANAMSQLDSLEEACDFSSEYARNKARLLRIRLNDKADILPTSDKEIKELLAYFQSHGTDRDKQEAYYYAASVYRDLQDTPRSIEYFLKSAEFETNKDIDSVMLRNSYSQIFGQYFGVQDYKNALWAAEKECEIASKLGILDNLSRIHCVVAQYRVEPNDKMRHILDEILRIETDADEKHNNPDIIIELLYTYCRLKDKENATKCFNLLPQKDALSGTYLSSIAEYYYFIGDIDSCIWCYEKALSTDDMDTKYDAANKLFYTYVKLGNKEQALHYAELFHDICAELNLGKRQELAATVNNQYKYYHDKEEEERIRNEHRMLAQLTCTIGIVCLFLIILSFAIFYYQKYRRTKELLNITYSLEEAKKECEAKKCALADTEEELQKNKEQLHQQINDITKIDLQLQHSEQELKEKTLLLEEKLKQNESLFRLLHQTDLNESANAVIESIRKAADGRGTLSDNTWEQFIAAVDNLYPNYHKEVIETLGPLKTEQLRVCYLLKAGLSNTQIENLITGASRATIWRWIKNYKSLLAGTINRLE